MKDVISAQPLSARKLSDDEFKRIRAGSEYSETKTERSQEMRLNTVLIEDGDFVEELDWLMVGRTVINGLSTTKGNRCNSLFVSAKSANAASSIVRFSTKRFGEIGQGTYNNVYKVRDLITGKVVALKKVRFDNLDPETVRFMSREILVLRRLNHPNVIKLEGLVISRISCSLYLVFEYMEHDLAGLAAVQTVKFTEPQIKCYMKQLLSGLEHCHDNGVLHRDKSWSLCETKWNYSTTSNYGTKSSTANG